MRGKTINKMQTIQSSKRKGGVMIHFSQLFNEINCGTDEVKCLVRYVEQLIQIVGSRIVRAKTFLHSMIDFSSTTGRLPYTNVCTERKVNIPQSLPFYYRGNSASGSSKEKFLYVSVFVNLTVHTAS